MSQYRFLQDAYIGAQFYLAGTTASTADVAGGTLPIGWKPGPYVDPLDTAAVNAFYAVGPQVAPLARQQWSITAVIPTVIPAVTFWQASTIPGSPSHSWTLTGLGAGLSAIVM
jgi:hypothetical protein